MRRLVLLSALSILATSAGGRSAFAHGGAYRGPIGGVPPNLRPPHDPQPPPPPPPPDEVPPSDTPETPPSGGPPTGAPPVTPPAGGGPAAPETESGHARRTAPLGFENWTFWWGNNRDDLLGVKDAIYRLRMTVDSPLAKIGAVRGNTNDATRATEKQVREVLVPALLWAMDPQNRPHPDTESAAYLALAKVTADPQHVRRIRAAVTDPSRDKIVRESAALALGLLRRGEGRATFDARELDGVRDFCFDVFADADQDTRTRAFAMFAVGLLGDQPTSRGLPAATAADAGPAHGGDGALGAPTASARIWDLLRDVERYPSHELPVALLLALSLQREETVTAEMADALATCAVKGKLHRQAVGELVQAYAALALGRVGTDLHVDPVLHAMTSRATGTHVKRSAAIALGQLGRRVDGARRAEIGASLVRAAETAKDASTRSFATISLAYLLEADVRAQRTDVLNAKGKVADYLVSVAERGNIVQRPFGALALGLVGRAIGEKAEVEEYGALRQRVEAVLRAGLVDSRVDPRTRGGFAVALGLLQDPGSVQRLTALVADRNEDAELRGYAAVAIGMIGDTAPAAVQALKSALRERSSEELRLHSAVGLGLLSDPQAIGLLLTELEAAETQNVQGQIVLALAKIGDARAIQPLVDVLKDDGRPALTRALATAGLGLIGDLERVSSLTRLSKDVNYRAQTESVAEVLTIL
jgi:HEAT repeat protein